MLSDTSPEAEMVQIELIRRGSVAERFAKVCLLTARAFGLSKWAIAGAGLEKWALELGVTDLVRKAWSEVES